MRILVWATNEQAELLREGMIQARRDFPAAEIFARNPTFYRRPGEAADAIYVDPTKPPIELCDDYAKRGAKVLPIGVEAGEFLSDESRLAAAAAEILSLQQELRAVTAERDEARQERAELEQEKNAVAEERDRALARVAELEAQLAASSQPTAPETEGDQPAEGERPRRKRG